MLRASARHLLVDTEEQCLTLKQQIAAGEDFAAVAQAHSNCPSKAQGGALGSFLRRSGRDFLDFLFTWENVDQSTK